MKAGEKSSLNVSRIHSELSDERMSAESTRT